MRVEEILEVAISTSVGGSRELAILIGHDGGMRIFDGAGWGPAGLLAEYGAREVYKVERRGSRILVAGQSASQTCRLERELMPSQHDRSTGRLTRLPNQIACNAPGISRLERMLAAGPELIAAD